MSQSAVKMIKWAVGIFVLLLVVLIGSCSSMYVNTEYERAVVTHLGKFSDTTGPGIHFKTPFLESVHKADTRIKQLDYPDLVVATRDGQVIGVSLTLNHRIEESEANLRNLYEQFGDNFDYEPRLLKALAIDRVKSVMGDYNMETFMEKRGEIRQKSLQAIQEAVESYGIHITDLQISDLSFSDRYKARLEEVAEQRAEAAKAEQIARQEGFKADQAVARAKGEAQSARELADAEAYQKTVSAKADAEARKARSVEEAAAIRREGEAKADAMRVQAQALRGTDGALVDLTKAEAMKNWDGSSTPSIIMGGSGGTSMIPYMNMSDLIKK